MVSPQNGVTRGEPLPPPPGDATVSLATNRSILYCHLPTITLLSEVVQDVIVEQATEGVRHSNLLGCSNMTAIKDSESLYLKKELSINVR